jgi:hypothetical protein
MNNQTDGDGKNSGNFFEKRNKRLQDMSIHEKECEDFVKKLNREKKER